MQSAKAQLKEAQMENKALSDATQFLQRLRRFLSSEFVVFHTRQAMEKQLSYVHKELQKTRDKAMIGACLWCSLVLFASVCSDREKTDVDGERWL